MSLLQNLDHELIPPDRTLFPFVLANGVEVMGTWQDWKDEEEKKNLAPASQQPGSSNPQTLTDVYPGMPSGYTDDLKYDSAII